MLQDDLRQDICPDVNPPGTANPVPCGDGGDAQFLFIPDLTNRAYGWVLVDPDRALRRLAAARRRC